MIFIKKKKKKKEPKLLANINGNINVEYRLFFLNLIKEKHLNDNINGYCISDLFNNETYQQRNKIYQALSIYLKEKKINSLYGPCEPIDILNAVANHIHIFDASYLSLITQKYEILHFDYTLTNNKAVNTISYNIFDQDYSTSIEPLVKNCLCTCCRQYSKAYLHHLLNANEMLGIVLLYIHNIYHFQQFFKQINIHNKSKQQFQLYRQKFIQLYYPE